MRRLAGSLAALLVSVLLGALPPNSAQAALSMRWAGVAGLVIDDGETALGFDLVFTRPGFLHWAAFRDLVPEPATIDRHLAVLGLEKLDALFVSHTHFDHAIDAPWIAQKLAATLYGGPSVERIARANEKRYAWSNLKFQAITDREVLEIGKFRVRPLRRAHAAIFPKLGFHFLAGAVPEDFDFGFDDYREGETWCYVIEHPEGKFFVDQGGQFFDGAAEWIAGVDFMAIGVSNKRSVADWVERFIRPYRPRVVIPLHFDWFFSAPNFEETRMLPGTDLAELRAETAKASPQTKFPVPAFGQKLLLPSLLTPVTVPAKAAPSAGAAIPATPASPVASPAPIPEAVVTPSSPAPELPD